MDIAKLFADKITAMLLAIAIGVLTILIVEGIFIVNNEHYRHSLKLNVLLFEFAIASSPFLAFAFLGITVRKPWIYGIILTVVLQGCGVYDGLTREDSNIGLGMLLIASPIIIVAIGLLTMRSRVRTPQDSGYD